MDDDDHTSPDAPARDLAGQLEVILGQVAEANPTPDLELIRRAYTLASEVHRFQRRMGANEPYIVHPLAVAGTCAEHRMDDVSVAAALLHDCIEDSRDGLRVTEPMLASNFGSEVAAIVEGLTKLQRQEVAPSTDPKLATLVKLLRSTATADLRTIIIKVFDRCDNVRSLEVFSDEKLQRIALETRKFYIPIAARLGFYKQARLMEDDVMRVLQPEAFASVSGWLAREGKRVERELGEKAREISEHLHGMRVACSYRVYHKGVFSIHQASGVERPSLERLNDGCNYNLCLVVGDVEACFRALNVVHRKLAHLRDSVKDFINSPKVNGYQSLHSICTGPTLPRVQVLIRTHEMDVDGHIGVVSQLRGGRLQDHQWLDELLDFLEGDGGEVLELTSQLTYAEAEVITPQGQVHKVPQGATALDYAYAIHTGLGERAAGAIIDGEVRPLRSVLRSGQRVEILTADDVRPTYERLDWVKTSRAALALRRAIRRTERGAFLAEAHAFFGFCQRRLDFPLDAGAPEVVGLLEALGLSDEEALGREIYAGRVAYDFLFAHLAASLPRPALDALLAELAREGVVDTSQIEVRQVLADEGATRLWIARTLLDRLQRKAFPEAPVAISGLWHSLPVRLAECCRPEFGDDIVALTAPERGATIHRWSCRDVRPLVQQSAPRLARASWKNPPRRQLAHLYLRGRDRRGLLQAIAEALVRMKLDAQSVQLAALSDGSAEGEIWLELPELISAAEVSERLASIPGLVQVVPARPTGVG
ncbi:MAG TPA: HD domain-containing protein [Thermoanaerobaculaceae bacterium]|nr:HD domain-containing protein [Thermoanaerobaculaceae bacterium]HPS76732.1 HD domain-containing protein [Thermoanaerobaculaceae bacterium]